MKTVVLGASSNPSRTSYLAISRLVDQGFDTYPVGLKEGSVAGLDILTDQPLIEEVHTVSLYVGKERQKGLYDYILSLKPKRIIFNPGAENDELYNLANDQGIEGVNACMLVMLSLDNYSE